MTGLISEQERRLEGRARDLWERLARTEARAGELARETERLRTAKEEAKRRVAERHPRLFATTREDYDDESLMSEAAGGDLGEIREMLLRGRGREESGTAERYGDHMANIRREAGVGSSRHSHIGGGGGGIAAAWPEDCVPVPVETFKKMVADLSAAAALNSKEKETGNKQQRRREVESPRVDTAEAAVDGDMRLLLQLSPKSNNDDTSNDAAELSQENNDDDDEEEEKVTAPPPAAAPRRNHKAKRVDAKLSREQEAAAPPPSCTREVEGAEEEREPKLQPATTTIKRATLPRPPPPDPSSSSTSSEIRVGKPRSSESSREPDENFVLESDAGAADKLYSSATSPDEESSSLDGARAVNRRYRPPDPRLTMDREESTPSEEKRNAEKKEEAKFSANFSLSRQQSRAPRVDSDDTEENGGGGAAAVAAAVESGVSGPSGLDDDDDFWN